MSTCSSNSPDIYPLVRLSAPVQNTDSCELSKSYADRDLLSLDRQPQRKLKLVARSNFFSVPVACVITVASPPVRAQVLLSLTILSIPGASLHLSFSNTQEVTHTILSSSQLFQHPSTVAPQHNCLGSCPQHGWRRC
jgi:hypothetical protein